MNKLQVFRRVLLPQMWIYALPVIESRMIMIKTSAVPSWGRGYCLLGAAAAPKPSLRIQIGGFGASGAQLFYQGLTGISEIVFAGLAARYNMGRGRNGVTGRRGRSG